MHTRPTRIARLSGIALTAVLVACGSDSAEGVLDREVFITTYVELRADALLSDDGQLSDDDRARVLQEHGVSEDDLLAFAQQHGRDLAFMREVWDEVEERLDAMRPVIDEDGRVVRPIRPEN